MARKKIVKAIVLIIIAFLLISGIINIVNSFTTGKQQIKVETGSSFYAGSNIEAVVQVNNYNGNKDRKGKVEVQLYDSNNKKVKKAEGKFDIVEGQDISVSVPIPEDLEDGSYDLKFVARRGFLKDTANAKISIISSSNNNTIISLDKGIYKPGDEINYRAVILSKRDNKPIDTEVSVFIYDGNENKVYSEKTNTSDFGIVSGKFDLADEVNSGTYKIVVKAGNQETEKAFTVNPYIAPKFEVTINTDKDSYIVGDEAQITVACKYFFGEPVTGASVEGTLNDETIMGLTDGEGNYKLSYKMSEAGKVDLKVNVTDTSNYMIEGSKTVYFGTDLFEIEILPEFDGLTTASNNDVYVFTKTASGSPVKTYSTVKLGNYSKQIISDEKGVGKVTFTKDELGEFISKAPISIVVEAKDMDGNVVKREKVCNFFDSTKTLIKTNKVKYNEGENIEIELVSKMDNDSNSISVFKGNELIKTATFEGASTQINLEGISGLVDIYVQKENSYYGTKTINDYTNYNNNYNTSNFTKRTIFIKPSKALNIDISLDSKEYEPGDTLNIGFTTTDEKKNTVDSALLVSILDDAILSLADNDLSIDNIKLALEDIELAEGVTAADVYASVIDESGSDTLLTGLLLKQQSSPSSMIKITNKRVYADDEIAKGVFKIVIAVIMICIYVLIKSEKARNALAKFIVPAINILIIFLLVRILIEESDVLSGFLNYNDILYNASAVAVAVISYILILYKFKEDIFNVILQLAVSGAIVAIAAIICEIFWKFEALSGLLIIGALVLFAFLFKLKKEGKLKQGIPYGTYTILIWLMKFAVFTFCVYTCTVELDAGAFGFIVCLIIYMIFEKFVFNREKIKKEPIKDEKIVINLTPMELIGMLIGIGLIIFIVFGIMHLYDNTQSTIKDALSLPVYREDDMPIYFNDSIQSSSGETSLDTMIKNSDSFSDETLSADVSSPISSMFNFASNISEESNRSPESTVEKVDFGETPTKTTEKTEKVRSIFLESLAFIPEIVTENGKASGAIPISDNITTWSIQVVGNTKDGNIGYASKEFKVFKEYFVDFSLPTNSIVGDKVSIPVTIYNYTDGDLNVSLDVKENNWATIGNYEKTIRVSGKGTRLVYVPIEIIKEGNNTLRVESKSDNLSDIVEKSLTVKIRGLEVNKIAASGIISDNYSMDILYDENYIPNSEKIRLKIYPSPIVQTIENIDEILRLPTGCFEQTSSSLYPDILVLKYLRNNNLSNEALESKALDYISKGYQKLLTYEVSGTKGGFSLYGNAPAEPVITAFGLMEFNELSEVYDVDKNVIDNMVEYLFTNQNLNGTFDYKSTYIGGASRCDETAMTAYIAWGLSEVCPDDARLSKTIKYLQDEVNSSMDSYTLALIANVFANTNTDASSVIKILKDRITVVEGGAYLSTSSYDYYGSYGRYQDVQATALASLAFSKLNTENKNNSELVNYIAASKSYCAWGTTQATILSLKAINEFSTNSDISKQTLTINFNGKSNTIEIKDDALDVYELEFDNVSKENRLSIGMKKGKLTYEVIKDYYVDYNTISENDNVKVSYTMTPATGVNGEVIQNIQLENLSNEIISNGLLKINIPQGTSVNEDSLLELKYRGIIEKYEYNYGTINLYFRDTNANSTISDITVKYRALYPEEITGGAVRFYDYYNPDIEAIAGPVNLNVN